ncbi:MAG TPA: hypothetical protein EYH31_12365 [Anaerolineae bacterium]|nr:hypothetical protein [Anaerolineae bacterium]
MNEQSKKLSYLGAVMLILMMLIAAFSLGVYVGEGGWTQGPPPIIGPGPAGPQPGQPPFPGQGQPQLQAPQRLPDLIGKLRRISHASLTLDTPTGPRTVEITLDTRVMRHDGHPMHLQELQPGVVLGIVGHLRTADGRVLVADTILVLPPPP